ncbi:uncharacterized protein LOC131688529 isoform X2 [Topomyia yanbarensis]|uniref:uncharacterized protein LOC131688529 isoform X2 n=1 Tax=Topomyia yanbarensis TaxID=2498891 RepID=UPI00273AAF2E|nr:uncharacterized protein LOC131688529 isoform X2 [Topomyia yanbarensis]
MSKSEQHNEAFDRKLVQLLTHYYQEIRQTGPSVWQKIALELQNDPEISQATNIRWQEISKYFQLTLVFKLPHLTSNQDIVDRLQYPYLKRVYSVTIRYFSVVPSQATNRKEDQIKDHKLFIKYDTDSQFDPEIVKVFKFHHWKGTRVTVDINVEDPVYALSRGEKDILIQMELQRRKRQMRHTEQEGKRKTEPGTWLQKGTKGTVTTASPGSPVILDGVPVQIDNDSQPQKDRSMPDLLEKQSLVINTQEYNDIIKESLEQELVPPTFSSIIHTNSDSESSPMAERLSPIPRRCDSVSGRRRKVTERLSSSLADNEKETEQVELEEGHLVPLSFAKSTSKLSIGANSNEDIYFVDASVSSRSLSKGINSVNANCINEVELNRHQVSEPPDHQPTSETASNPHSDVNPLDDFFTDNEDDNSVIKNSCPSCESPVEENCSNVNHIINNDTGKNKNDGHVSTHSIPDEEETNHEVKAEIIDFPEQDSDINILDRRVQYVSHLDHLLNNFFTDSDDSAIGSNGSPRESDTGEGNKNRRSATCHNDCEEPQLIQHDASIRHDHQCINSDSVSTPEVVPNTDVPGLPDKGNLGHDQQLLAELGLINNSKRNNAEHQCEVRPHLDMSSPEAASHSQPDEVQMQPEVIVAPNIVLEDFFTDNEEDDSAIDSDCSLRGHCSAERNDCSANSINNSVEPQLNQHENLVPEYLDEEQIPHDQQLVVEPCSVNNSRAELHCEARSIDNTINDSGGRQINQHEKLVPQLPNDKQPCSVTNSNMELQYEAHSVDNFDNDCNQRSRISILTVFPSEFNADFSFNVTEPNDPIAVEEHISIQLCLSNGSADHNYSATAEHQRSEETASPSSSTVSSMVPHRWATIHNLLHPSINQRLLLQQVLRSCRPQLYSKTANPFPNVLELVPTVQLILFPNKKASDLTSGTIIMEMVYAITCQILLGCQPHNPFNTSREPLSPTIPERCGTPAVTADCQPGSSVRRKLKRPRVRYSQLPPAGTDSSDDEMEEDPRAKRKKPHQLTTEKSVEGELAEI